MKRKYNIIVIPNGEIPLEELEAAGIKIHDEQLSNFKKGIPQYLGEARVIKESILMDIVIWLWCNDHGNLEFLEWLDKVSSEEYLKCALESKFGPLCDIAYRNLRTVSEFIYNLYLCVKADGDNGLPERLNLAPKNKLDVIASLIECFVKVGYLSQEDYIERNIPVAIELVDDPHFGMFEVVNLLFCYDKCEFDMDWIYESVEEFRLNTDSDAKLFLFHESEAYGDLCDYY